MTEHRGEDLHGHRFVDCDFTGADFREVRLRGARILGAEMVDVEIDAWISNVRINDVDVVPLIEAELDRRHPERLVLRSTDPDGVREALAILEEQWADTINALQDVPEATLHERVDGEWSFVETLRHLVFVNDSWFRRTVLGMGADAFHRYGLAPTFLGAVDGLDGAARPAYAEALGARQHRTARLRKYLDWAPSTELARACAPNPEPGYPPATERPVIECLHIVFDEEWAHHRFAVRDLRRLGVL